jgi:hypothetical protein
MSPQTVQVSSIRFLASLPAADESDIDATHDATTDAEAKYVEVIAVPITLTNILPASFIGGANSKTAGAVAVAGRGDLTICDIPPVYICNPYETPGNSDAAATAALEAAMRIPLERRRV